MYMCPCALCGARAARVAAMATKPFSMAIVLLLCWSAPSDNFGHAYRVYISKNEVRVRLGQYMRHSPGCATLAAPLPIRHPGQSTLRT